MWKLAGRVVAAALAGIMAMTGAALAAASAPKPGSPAREYAATLPPIGFVEFCQRNPEHCQPEALRHRKVEMTGDKWLLVRMVNSFVNGAIAPVTDETLYGTPEYWTIPSDAGDCEDVALLKQDILEKKGFPADALRMTVVLDEHGEGHAVLSLVTSEGDFILDNRRNDIRSWENTGYTLLKRQSAQDPRKWVALEPERSNNALAGTASK